MRTEVRQEIYRIQRPRVEVVVVNTRIVVSSLSFVLVNFYVLFIFLSVSVGFFAASWRGHELCGLGGALGHATHDNTRISYLKPTLLAPTRPLFCHS